MKSQLSLLRRILEDSGVFCDTSTTRDWKTISERVQCRGLAFLTLDLPTFHDGFITALDEGRIYPQLFPLFGSRWSRPRFLSGFLDKVFEPKTGILRDEPDINAILCIRQITLAYSKINLPCSPKREKAAFDQFITCEHTLRSSSFDDYYLSKFEEVCFYLYQKLFNSLDQSIARGEIIPRHGPGATADKLRGNSKFTLRSWPSRAESIFPARDFLFPNLRFTTEDCVQYIEPEAEQPVRVISVPKTLKTPRIIAIEPTCMQYMQQGLMSHIVEFIERDDILSKFIGFSDQTLNQSLARDGSLYGDLATLDLSEASDRVHNRLVTGMLRRFPYSNVGIQACRSARADVPGHGIIPLAKYASMGSALTFPLEAMVFNAIIFSAISEYYNIPASKLPFERFVGQVRVYGDDIIVPVYLVSTVIRWLEKMNLVVNKSKSFWTGRFRESCGKEYYDGHDVSIVKIRHMLPGARQHATQLISAVETRNQFYKAGFWRTAAFLDYKLERLIPFPYCTESSEALGRFSFVGYESPGKEDLHLQKPLIKAAVAVSSSPSDYIDGEDALLKCLITGFNPDEHHLRRAGRPRHVYIKTRWVDPN